MGRESDGTSLLSVWEIYKIYLLIGAMSSR